MFMELVANPIPNAMADSTPRNLAVSFSRSSCLSRLPEVQQQDTDQSVAVEVETLSTMTM